MLPFAGRVQLASAKTRPQPRRRRPSRICDRARLNPVAVLKLPVVLREKVLWGATARVAVLPVVVARERLNKPLAC